MSPVFPDALTPTRFLQHYWQRRPLLARAALPQFRNMITRAGLFRLATRDDVRSRLVLRTGRTWQLEHGPFARRALARLPDSGWTLLVQGVNEVLPRAAELLGAFDFLPHARVDDVMVSYAPPGGGVGPHFDSYDVFLLQGTGERRWRISNQRDLDLVASAPLKILKRFRPAQQWVLAPGDMLYLPPSVAHEGVAVTECLTYSIGFRAPTAREWAAGFLDHLQEGLQLTGAYRDPDPGLATHPARIPAAMITQVSRMLEKIRWTRSDVAHFIGRHLTEPSAQTVYAPPHPALAQSAFRRAAGLSGLRLALRTRMLFQGSVLYINGENVQLRGHLPPSLVELADRRQLGPGFTTDETAWNNLYQWYRAGYIEIGRQHPPTSGSTT